MWRRACVARGSWLPRHTHATLSTAVGFAARSTHTATAAKFDPSLVEIDPYVVEFLPPKDWTDYQYPPKITTLGEQLCALKETEYTGVMEFIKLQLDIKEKPQGQIIIAAPTAQAGPAQAAPAAEEEKPKEKSSYKLVLTALPDDAKIKVLKEVRVLRPGMKLLESKALVDKLPSILKDEMPKAEAEEWQKKLKEVGATCELQ